MNKLIACLSFCLLLNFTAFAEKIVIPFHASPAEPPGNKPCFFTPLKDTFLIGIFWPPVWNHTNEEQYQRMEDAHIDIIQNVSSTDLYTEEKNKKMLMLAQQHKLKILVADPRVHGTDREIAEMVKAYRNNPATAGYYIMDEPDTAKLQWCAETYRKILAVDPNKMIHVNLFPVYALGGQLGSIDYEKDYVERWIKTVAPQKLKYLSFDHYPFSDKGTFRESYYTNLDIIRRVGLAYNIKTSAYLQSMGIHGAFKRPDADELRFNVYSMLAYGIKHPVWFTYWTPTGQGENFLPAIIDSAGNKTDLYIPFQQLNAEMKQLGKTLIDLDANEVYHTGNNIPKDIPALPENTVLKPEDRSASLIITFFTHKKSKTKYVMIVNKSYKESKTYSFVLGEKIKKIEKVSKNTGKPLSVKMNILQHKINETFLPGEGKLYLLK